MQGTVATFDQSTRGGSLLTDEGMPLAFAAESLADHIRHLRVGQRVFVETSPTGTVTAIQIWTPPLTGHFSLGDGSLLVL